MSDLSRYPKRKQKLVTSLSLYFKDDAEKAKYELFKKHCEANGFSNSKVVFRLINEYMAALVTTQSKDGQ